MLLLRRKLPELRQRGFAALYDKVQVRAEAKLAAYRERTAGRATGDVLEIGGGTGANLPYFTKDARLTVIEPNPYMARRLKQKAMEIDRDIDIVSDIDDTIPFADASFDSVVTTLVLCSVPDLTGEL